MREESQGMRVSGTEEKKNRRGQETRVKERAKEQ